MILLNDSITVGRTPADVFAFVADLNNIPRWQADVVTSHVITPGPTRVGTRFTEDVKLGPIRSTAECEVTEFEPARRMSYVVKSSAIACYGRLTVEPADGGAKLTMDGTIRLRGLWKLLQPMIKREIGRAIHQELVTVKTILETEKISALSPKVARIA